MQLIWAQANIAVVLFAFIASLIILSKSTDILVDNAVKLSSIWGLSEVIIGATVVSLGTTLPELSSSIIATIEGVKGFAIGNAVGSTITNTSLVLGLSAMFGAIPVGRESSRKLSILIAVVFVLIGVSLLSKYVSDSGSLPQWLGFVFVPAAAAYIIVMTRQKKVAVELNSDDPAASAAVRLRQNKAVVSLVIKVLISALIVAFGASVLVDSARIMAARIGIPEVVISSTIVAFGTSAPEISTAISSAKRGHGGLALGNVMGANVLNILFVLGSSLALTSKFMVIPQNFYYIHIPALIIVLAVFSYISYNSKRHRISKKEGAFLITIYLLYIIGNLISVYL